MCDFKGELKTKKRVSDMLITMHATLRDEYRNKSIFISTIVMAGSVWITALAFVSDGLGEKLTPFDLSPDLWIGLLSICVFFFSLLELKIDWAGKSNAHQKAAELYMKVKKEATGLLALSRDITESEKAQFYNLVDFANSGAVPVPDKRFNHLKKMHCIKVEISKYLSAHPGTSIFLFRLWLWWRDNILILFKEKKGE